MYTPQLPPAFQGLVYPQRADIFWPYYDPGFWFGHTHTHKKKKKKKAAAAALARYSSTP